MYLYSKIIRRPLSRSVRNTEVTVYYVKNITKLPSVFFFQNYFVRFLFVCLVPDNYKKEHNCFYFRAIKIQIVWNGSIEISLGVTTRRIKSFQAWMIQKNTRKKRPTIKNIEKKSYLSNKI